MDINIKDEGSVFYNIGCKFNSKLSDIFDIRKPINISTPLGEIYSFENLFMYLRYQTDSKILTNPKVNSILKTNLKKRKYNTVKNYSAILLIVIFKYLETNNEYIEDLKEVDLSLPFTSYIKFSNCNFTGNVYKADKSLNKFGTLIYTVIKLIKEEKFTNVEKSKLIKDNMISDNLFDGILDFIA